MVLRVQLHAPFVVVYGHVVVFEVIVAYADRVVVGVVVRVDFY